MTPTVAVVASGVAAVAVTVVAHSADKLTFFAWPFVALFAANDANRTLGSRSLCGC